MNLVYAHASDWSMDGFGEAVVGLWDFAWLYAGGVLRIQCIDLFYFVDKDKKNCF